MKDRKYFVVRHLTSLVLAIGSLVYGIQLVRHPEILLNFSVYQHIIELFNPRFVGVVFILLSLLKLIGLFTNQQWLRRYSLVAFTYVWSFFSLSFLLSQPTNTVWIFALIMAAISVSISVRGDFTK